MINILADCSSPALWSTLSIMKKVFLLIEIVAPILLIVSLIMNITKLVANPEDKKLPKKILHSVLATVIIFFIPLIVNVLMNALGEDFEVSACWNTASNITENTDYIDQSNGTKKKIYDNSNKYEK